MSDDSARMQRFTLRFVDAELEASFNEEQARKSRPLIRQATLWTGAIMLITWALLGVMFPRAPDVHARVALPFGVILFTLVTGYVLSGRTRYLRFHQRVMAIGMCVMAAAMIGWISAGAK